MSLKKSHKSYPQAFKDEAVLMVLEQGYSVADAAKSLGVSTSLLYNWKEKHEAKKQGVSTEESERDESLGVSDDEVKFYDALANNEAAVLELGDEILKKIAHEPTDNLRANISVDWSQRESVRAKLRIMVKRILRKYKYPPDQADGAVQLVLQQAEALGEQWAA
ncbi:type I restriction enzyme endonuclease domain-containing protein [Shewanella sp. W3-18-1]|uniref:type I restriction enzyme endonuclease domain-containing protein n=1 Tax=Shewanella sp. (strain W3-18-1) TaxID=351745 RepID=UPI00005FD8EE|nr:type I restriction enzyme endonuclease domain-containing protein [Shewanella sp. W3-18-1]ABM23162.1 transposase IS3/IS911 family protein [Shewanella sp. W3-18-1]